MKSHIEIIFFIEKKKHYFDVTRSLLLFNYQLTLHLILTSLDDPFFFEIQFNYFRCYLFYLFYYWWFIGDIALIYRHMTTDTFLIRSEDRTILHQQVPRVDCSLLSIATECIHMCKSGHRRSFNYPKRDLLFRLQERWGSPLSSI